MALPVSKSREVRERIDRAKEYFVMLANALRNIEVILHDAEVKPLTPSGVYNLRRLKTVASQKFRMMTRELGMGSLLKDASPSETPDESL